MIKIITHFLWHIILEKAMAICSSIFAWKIPWTEVPGELQPMELQRVGYNSVTENVPHCLSKEEIIISYFFKCLVTL